MFLAKSFTESSRYVFDHFLLLLDSVHFEERFCFRLLSKTNIKCMETVDIFYYQSLLLGKKCLATVLLN